MSLTGSVVLQKKDVAAGAAVSHWMFLHAPILVPWNAYLEQRLNRISRIKWVFIKDLQ